jgi:vanillate O-demethylase monooxygenase subunit
MEFLRNAWYLVAWSGELAVGEMTSRTVLERPLLLSRGTDGRAFALDDRCPHRFAPLSRGSFDGRTITCGYHGLQFDTGGRCTRNPHGAGVVPRAASVEEYTVVERHGGVWWWAGDRTPDETLLPDFEPLDAEDSTTRRDHFVMDVPHDLIIDNLLDCSHTSFLHDEILGNAAMLDTATTVVQDGDSINVIRESGSVPPPGMFDMLFHDNGEPVDTWTDFRWDPPSHLLLDVGVTAPGRPRSEGIGLLGTHILTPETATTTHYFTTASRWGVRPGTETEEMRLKISDMRRFAFEEQDEPMIRAQHATVLAFLRCEADQPEPVMLETDAGVVRWRRIMAGLLAAERSAARQPGSSGPIPQGASASPIPQDVIRPVRREGFRSAVVTEIVTVAEDVRSFRLHAVDGPTLGPADPGSHIDVRTYRGPIRQYSLCDGGAEGVYTIAVKLETPSRGGSAAMHALQPGAVVEICGPRNHFPLAANADRHLLVAGGIGITPLIAMFRHLRDRGADVELHYFARSIDHVAFHEEIAAAPDARLHLGHGPVGTGAALDDILAGPGGNDHVYVCGPAGLIDAVHARARAAGWPDGSVHDERFTPASTVMAGDGRFKAVLERSGRTIEVGHDQTILDAVLGAGVDVASSCEQGICGTCVTGVLGGAIEHRDSYLTDDEKTSGDRMCICVSRGAGSELRLDL